MRPISESGNIISNRQVSVATWEMIVRSPVIATNSKAGQFVHVRTGSGFNPFLRRPLSIGPVDGENLRLIFTIRGEGTRLLALKQSGELIDLIGPLGNGFQSPEPGQSAVLIGGGIGVVPLLLLNNQIEDNIPTAFFLGVQSKEHLPVTAHEIETLKISVSSDSGGIGYKGTVIDLFLSRLDEFDLKSLRIYSCGPSPMLSKLKELCIKFDIPAQVSLEVPMGCGIGACQSCAAQKADSDEYLLVCKDGPAFDIREVVLSKGLAF